MREVDAEAAGHPHHTTSPRKVLVQTEPPTTENPWGVMQWIDADLIDTTPLAVLDRHHDGKESQ